MAKRIHDKNILKSLEIFKDIITMLSVKFIFVYCDLSVFFVKFTQNTNVREESY